MTLEVGNNQGTDSTVAVTAPEKTASTPPPQATQPAAASGGKSTKGKTTPPPAATADTGNQGDGLEKPEVPAYKPNLNYKVAGQEKLFDEFLHGVVKDEETEKKLRKLYEDAEGTAFMKQDRQRVLDAFNKVYPEYQEQQQKLERLGGFIQDGNLAAFQRETNISDTMILKRAQQILQHMENPQLKAQEDKEYSHLESMQSMQQQNQRLLAQVVQVRRNELDLIMEQPQVAAAAQAFNQRKGNPEAFKQEIIDRGSMYWNVYGQDKSAQELVSELLGFMGIAQGGSQAQPQVFSQTAEVATGGEAPAQGTRVVPPKKPVVPNLAGKGTSPVKKPITSLDGLRERARELAAQQAQGAG